MRLSTGAIAIAMIVVLTAGCTEMRDAPGPGYDAAGPRVALLRWHQALVGGNRTAYLASFTGTQEELVLALAIYDAVRVNYRFRDAVVAKYGADAWKTFETEGAARVHLFPNAPDWTTRITVVETGDTAVGYLPRARVPMYLSRSDGVWRIHAASLVPPGITADKGAYYLYRWVATMEEMILWVQQPERRLADLKPETGEEAYKAKLEAREFGDATESLDSFLIP